MRSSFPALPAIQTLSAPIASDCFCYSSGLPSHVLICCKILHLLLFITLFAEETISSILLCSWDFLRLFHRNGEYFKLCSLAYLNGVKWKCSCQIINTFCKFSSSKHPSSVYVTTSECVCLLSASFIFLLPI